MINPARTSLVSSQRSPDSPAGCGGDIDTQSERWTVGQTIQYNTIRYDTIQYNTSSLPLPYRPDAFCVSYSAPRLARPLHWCFPIVPILRKDHWWQCRIILQLRYSHLYIYVHSSLKCGLSSVPVLVERIAYLRGRLGLGLGRISVQMLLSNRKSKIYLYRTFIQRPFWGYHRPNSVTPI